MPSRFTDRSGRSATWPGCHCQASDPTSPLPAGADGCPVDEPVVSNLAAGLEVLRMAIAQDQSSHPSLSELLHSEVTASTIRRLLAEADTAEPNKDDGASHLTVVTRPSQLALPAPSISLTDLLTQTVNERKGSTHGITPADHDSQR